MKIVNSILFLVGCAARHAPPPVPTIKVEPETTISFIPSGLFSGCPGKPEGSSLTNSDMEQVARLLRTTVFFKTPVIFASRTSDEVPHQIAVPERYAIVHPEGILMLVDSGYLVQYRVYKRGVMPHIQWLLRVCRQAE